MATETSIQESVCLKKDESEEIALISECFKEKVTEFLGNKVMQLETSSPVVETVNTPLETVEPKDESGIFVQALSVPMVIADEHSNTPESFKAVKQTEPEKETKKNEEKAIASERCEDDAPEKAEHEVGSKLFDSETPSMKEALNMLEKNQSDSDGVTSSKDAACAEQHATTVTNFKEQDLNETPREFAKDSNDKSVDGQEASEQCEIRSNDVEEQKSDVSVKKIEQDEETEELRPGVEMEKREQSGLSQEITSDACISTKTKAQAETIEHEEDRAQESDNHSIKEVCEENISVKAEKDSGMQLDEKAMPASNKDENEEKEQEVNVLENDQEKDDITSAQEATFEGGLQEKNHHNEDSEHEVVKATGSVEEDTDVCVSTETAIVEEIIKNEELHDEKAVEKDVCAENGLEKAEIEISDRMAPSQKETLSMIEKDQGGSDGVTSSQEAPCVDVEETTTVQHAATVIDFKEQDLNEKPELNGDETEDKSLDAQEASKECNKGAKEDIEKNPEESVTMIEKEEETEEIKPCVEIEKEKEQNELLPSTTTDVCISTQTESQVEKAEHVEEDTQNDGSLKEKPNNPSIKEVCEEKIEKEEEAEEIEPGVEIEEKKEQNELLSSIPTDVCISTQTESHVEKSGYVEEDTQNDDSLKEKPDSPSIKEVCEEKIEIKEEAKELKPGVEIKEKKEQNELLSSIPTDVCISTQTESQVEKADLVKEDTQNDEGLKEKPDGPSIKEVCEETGTEKDEYEEAKHSAIKAVNKDETEDEKRDQEVNMLEKYEDKDCVTSAQNMAFEKELQEKNHHNEDEAVTAGGSTEKDTEDIRSSKKTEQQMRIKSIPSDVCITTQTEPEEQTTEKNVGEAIESDDGQTKKSENVSEKTESEGIKLAGGSGMALNENGTMRKDEVQEMEQEFYVSEKGQSGEDDVPISETASNEEIKEKTIDQHDTTVAYLETGQGLSAMHREILVEEAEDKSIDAQKETGQCADGADDEREQKQEKSADETAQSCSKDEQEENTKEIKPSVETIEAKDVYITTPIESQDDATKNKEDAIESDGDQKEKSDNPIVNEVSEENDSKTESEEERQLLDSSNVKTIESMDENTKETKSSNEAKENIEQQDEIKPLEVQAGEDDVTSSQNTSTEDVKETMNGQHDTTMAYVEEGTDVSALPKEILIGEAEDKSIGAEEVSLELGQPNKQNVEDNHPCLSKTTSEHSEDEIKKENKDLYHESAEDTNDITTKEETCTSTPDPVEEHIGRDEASKEVTNLDETTVEPQEGVTPSIPLEISTEDASNSENGKTECENLPTEDEVHIPELGPKSEESMLEEECFVPETETHSAEEKETVIKEVSSNEKTEQTTEINQEVVKEICEETSSEKTELGEGLQLSDSSNVKINEEEVTTLEDVDQVNMSAESQGDDNITSTQNEASEEKEDLKEKNYHNEDNEGDFIKSGESVDDDTEEIKSSAEINDSTEHVIATNVCSSTQMENNEETVENEEKNGEMAIEYEENETVSREEHLEKKQEDVEETNIGEHVTTVAYFVEGQSLGALTKEVQGKEGDKSVVVQEESEQYDDGKNYEREQKPEEHTGEIKPSVETNEEKDDCISTQTESQEEATKNEENAIGSDLNKSESEEERHLSDISSVKTRESVDEDTEETKSSDPTKEYVEKQGLLHVVSPDVFSSTQTEKNTECEENNNEETIENKDGQAEKPESPLVQVVCEATSSAMVESEEGVKHNDSFSMSLKENETMSKKEKLEKEDEIETSEEQGGGDDVTSSCNASNEDIKETTIGQHDTIVAYVEEGQGVSVVPKEILIEESEDKSIDAKEMSLDLGQSNEQNVEETNTRPSKTLSENPEDEIKKEDEDLSLESVADTNDSTTKEEKCTLEHEPVEEHIGQDEVSKEKVPVLNETTEVEPQDDITHSTPLKTSTEDASNSEMENTKSENLPIVHEVDIPESVPKSEESTLKDELFISETGTHSDEVKGTVTEEILSDEKTEQTTEINQETVKEVCEETTSEKAEIGEGLELCDSSDMKINKKEILGFKDDNQEKDQDVMATESGGEDNIKNSQNEVSEEKEDLQERTYHNEDDEHDFIKSTEGVDEDTKEVKPSVETKENTEHVIATSDCSSPQIETDEGTVKNDEKAIENDKNKIVSREENLEKKHEDVSSSAQTETIESEEKNEEATKNDDGKENLENQKKEQELEITKFHGGGDDVISSQNASNENTRETTIDQHVNTMVHSEEGLCVNAITKELIKEEVDDKSVHAQEASEQCEKEAKDKTEQQPDESVNKPENSCSETIDRSIEEDADTGNKEIKSNLEAENQADRTEDKNEMKDEAVFSEKITKELGEPEEKNIEKVQACLNETITEKTEDKITKDGVSSNVSNDTIEHVNECISKEEKCFPDGITKETEISILEHEPVKEQNDSQDEVSSEKFTDLNETTSEPQEDVKPSSSLETSTEETSHSDEAKVESEILPKEELESVAEMHIPDVMPKSEGSKMKEECLISATKETTSYENLETHGSTQPENSYSTTEENITQVEQTGEINSLNENRDMKEDVTQESQLSSTEDRIEMVKGVILAEEVPLEIENKKGMNDFKEQTVEKDNYSPELEEKSAQNQKEIVHEISNSDSIPVENPDVTEVNVDGQLGQENLQGKEDVNCASRVTNDRVDQEPKEERIPSLEDAATVVSQVNLSNTESTAYPSETEKLAIKAIESDCDVQIPEIVADSEDSKVTEECTVLDTAVYTDENNVEQDTKFNEIASALDKEQKDVKEIPTKSDEAKNPDLIIEDKAVTKEILDIHGQLEPASEPVIEENQVAIEIKPQPEQSNITCENIVDEQILESKLEYTSGKKLKDGREDMEEDVTLAPENESKSTESHNETTKNIILTDEVAVQTEKEKESHEIEGQVSEKDNCPTELDNTSTPNQKELENEIKCSKTIPVGNTEVKEVKSESQIEVESMQGAEELTCISKASSIIETSKVEMHEDTEQTITIIGEVKDDDKDEASKNKTIPALEDPKTSERQVNLSEIDPTDTPSNAQDSMKREDTACREQETIEEKEDQRSINERCIEEQAQANFAVEIKDAKSGNETVEDVIINKVLLEDEKAKESRSKEDIINEDAKLNQLTSYTDEVCQIKSSRPDELEAKDPVEDTEDVKFMADNLIVKDETSTVMKEPNEDIEIVASEFKRLENMATVENKIEVHADEEKEALNKPQEDDSAKTTEDSKIITEVAAIVPECGEASVILTDNLPEASPVMLLAKPEDEIKDKDATLVDVYLSTLSDEKTGGLQVSTLDEGKQHGPGDMLNKEKDAVQVQEHISSIKSVDPSTEVEVHETGKGLLKDNEHLESACNQGKPIDEVSGMKQEPLGLNAPGTLGTAATESTESKIFTEKVGSSHEQGEQIAKSLNPEAANSTANKASGTEPQCTNTVFIDQKEKSESVEPAKIYLTNVLHQPAEGSSEVSENLIGERDSALTKDQQVKKNEIGESGVKTDEEDDEEEEDNEDDEKMGSCSDAPVMVEASKDMDVKAHKKSHNILSGVGSKVKHSIAKVKKAITGKSSPPKSPSPKAKNQVIG